MYWPSGDQASVRIWCEVVKLRDVVASLSTVVLKLPNLFANCVGTMRFGNGGIAPLLMMQKLVDGGRMQDTKDGRSYNAKKLALVGWQ